ncbi:Type I restriction-modification system, specificity subunit S [Vibrio chagasii]|nr:Type I restriction-modification system, specificity subunit S [Vibrio chagasii]
MVPNDWSLRLISDTAKVITGNTPSTKEPSYYGGEIPFVSPADLGSSKLISSTNKTLTLKGFEKSRAIRKGATLFTCIGSTIGKLGQANCELATNQQINAVVPFPSFDDDFIYYQLKMRAKFISKLAGTQAVPIINKTTFESQSLLAPDSLPEQHKIAKIISTWDKAITTTKKLIETSKQQKKALMQQLLTGKKRLVNPDTGEAFEGKWEEVHIGDICKVNPKKPSEPQNGLVSFIPMDAVSEDAKLLRAEVRKYTDVSKGFTSFKDADTLIAKITPCFENGKGAKVDGLENGVGFGSTEFHVLRAKKGTCPDFIYFITNTSAFRVRGEMNMQGSAGQKRVTTDYLKVYKMVVPKELAEQQKIASVLTAADKEIEVFEAKLTHLKLERKALMQQLLTGKRRVKVDDMEVA